MRIKIKQLRSLIREVALSPSLKNKQPLESPMANKNVVELVKKLESAFENALSLDLIVRAFDEHYDPETREFDDHVYENIKDIVTSSREKAAAIVKRGLESVWSDASDQIVSSDAPSGVHKKVA